MRSLIISIISLVVIITVWGFFVNYADKNIHELTGIIEDDILENVYAQNWDKAENQVSDLSKKWHDQKKTYTFFFDTAAVMETDYSIARAKQYIAAKDVTLASVELSCIKEQLGFLHLNELITLDNIF